MVTRVSGREGGGGANSLLVEGMEGVRGDGTNKRIMETSWAKRHLTMGRTH